MQHKMSKLARTGMNPSIFGLQSLHGVKCYRISSVIRPSFFFFQNNLKDLDPSCKMDLDLLDCLGWVNLVL